MEVLVGSRILIDISILLLTIHFPEFEGHQHGTTSPTSGEDLTSSPGLDGFVKRTLKEEIEVQLQSRRAKNFLDGLSNQFQREIVLTNLRRCPFVPLCQFELNFDPQDYYILRSYPCCTRCSCDKKKCLSYGNCCPDILWSGNNTSDLTYDDRMKCVPTEIRGINALSVHSIKAISVCPTHSESELVTKCVRNYHSSLRNVELEDITLVSDISSDRIYRNKYCAECNFVNASSRVQWSAKLVCSRLQELSIINSSMELIEQIWNGKVFCDIKFQQTQTNTNIRSCTHQISVCNYTGLWESYDADLEKACGLYGSSYRAQNNQIFRNVFCARCNSFNPMATDICPYDFVPPTTIDFSGFLRLSDSKQDSSDSCGKGEMYDSIKEKCRQTVCSAGRRLKNRHCELIFDGIVNMNLDINLRLDPQDPIPLHLAYDIVPSVKRVVLGEIYDRTDRLTFCSVQVLLQSNILSENTTDRNRFSDEWGEVAGQRNASQLLFYLLRIQVSVKARLEKTVESLKSLNGTFVSLNVTAAERLYVDKSLPLFAMMLVQDTNERKFDKISSLIEDAFQEKNVTDAVSLSNSLSLFNDDDNKLHIPHMPWANRSHNKCKQPRYALLSFKSCPMFKIVWEEFDWKENNDGIEMDGTSIRLDAEDYTIVTKSESKYLLVCVDTYLEIFKSVKQSESDIAWDPVTRVKIVLSVICVFASVIGLLFSLVTYCMIKQLRTLPGKNNIALIVSLIFAQVCYLVAGTTNFDLNSRICKTIGLLTHFFWLLSMFWMNICTFHMCQVLMKTRNVSKHNNSKRYFLYHLYCITLTLLCVCINVGVSIATSDATDIGYGNIICYISTQKMVDFTFGVPSVLVVVSNFGMFLAIMISLKRQPTIRQNAKNDRNYFVIFVKLSTVTGITWIFGFLYMWTGIEALSFLFIISNGSQGLFIMLAFVCNKRTLTLYKELLVMVLHRFPRGK